MTFGASEIIVGKRTNCTKSVDQVFQKLFPVHLELQSRLIKLDIENITIPVLEDELHDVFEKQITPLFKKVLYNNTSYPKENLPALPCPLIAFHSYKGGVGRMLSLLAFVKA